MLPHIVDSLWYIRTLQDGCIADSALPHLLVVDNMLCYKPSKFT